MGMHACECAILSIISAFKEYLFLCVSQSLFDGGERNTKQKGKGNIRTEEG